MNVANINFDEENFNNQMQHCFIDKALRDQKAVSGESFDKLPVIHASNLLNFSCQTFALASYAVFSVQKVIDVCMQLALIVT